MRVIEHHCLVAFIETIGVMVDKDLTEAAIGVKLEHCKKIFFWVFLADSVYCCEDF